MSQITRQLVVTIKVDDSLFPDHGALSRLVQSVLADRRHGLAVDSIAVREIDREETLKAVANFWRPKYGDSTSELRHATAVGLAYVLESILAAPYGESS